jgi:uncharacterized protein YndB with AHSA1/START domain
MRQAILLLFCTAVLPATAAAQETELRFVVDVPVTVEDAFRMWTDSARASEFLAEDVRIDPWVGGRYETLFDPENDPAGARAGTCGSKILELEAPRRLVFEWHSLTPRLAAAEVGGLRVLQETTVEVTFEPIGESRTRIHIRHYGFGSDANWAAALRFYTEVGWPWVIRRLEGRFATE